jgi:hypothetical protein
MEISKDCSHIVRQWLQDDLRMVMMMVKTILLTLSVLVANH